MPATSHLLQENGRSDVLPALTLNDRLALIALIDEGTRGSAEESPLVADLFNNLWNLVGATVSGSKISRLKPEGARNGFQVFEITSESGEALGRLHMLYLKKPIPCYYLVYVEVAPPFRKKGLGNRILAYYREFLESRSAVGILDNIIPANDPTFDIYTKQAWEPIEAIIGDGVSDPLDHYMIYVPPALRGRDLREPALRLIYHLKRKRAAIDMRENELMVKRTIAEFRALYDALLLYFEPELGNPSPSPLLRFTFTRFVTKLIAFRRRIGDLIGYTGGDSLEQLQLAPAIARLPAQSYAPRVLASKPAFVSGDTLLWSRLPENFRTRPAQSIEALPNYARPSFTAWRQARSRGDGEPLTLGDLMDLGFDPTRLKEVLLDGRGHIFERIQVRQIQELERKGRLLAKLASGLGAARAGGSPLRVNPPLLIIRDRGNAYVLRRKVEGIHWEEALEQLQTVPQLKDLNAQIAVDRLIAATVREAARLIAGRLDSSAETVQDQLAFFVSWNLASNRPGLYIDFASHSLESVWVA